MDFISLLDTLHVTETPRIKNAEDAMSFLQAHHLQAVSYRVTRHFRILMPVPGERHIILFTSEADLCSNIQCTVPYIITIGSSKLEQNAFVNERHVKKTIEFLIDPKSYEFAFTLSYTATMLEPGLYKRFLLTCAL